MRYILGLVLLFACLKTVNAKGIHYVFYLHGQIVEGSKGDPVSESYGRYEYHHILETFQNRGYVVLSEVRQANTEALSYAIKIAMQIDSLKNKGVPSENITVIGASKGAVITMLVSQQVKDKKVKYVIMAGCSQQTADVYHFNLYGQILSIYEKSDQIGRSCKDIKAASMGVSKFKEILLNTGLQHGFLYRPLNEWVIPACVWIEK